MLLPKMGGELVLRRLKQDPTTAHIPVIVVSSLPQSEAEKLTHGEAIAHIEKSRLSLATGSENLLTLVNAELRKAKHRVAIGG
jgi:CheY-like chemotaxis protein